VKSKGSILQNFKDKTYIQMDRHLTATYANAYGTGAMQPA